MHTRTHTSPPIRASTWPLREPLLTRDDQEAGAASGTVPPQPSSTVPPSGDTAYATHLKAAMYGVINTVVVAPVVVGFAAIIFRHPAFHVDPAVYPALVKLVLFSSMVHQAAFSAFSSLPFSIGQVQDAGLIFLSKMASDLADATAGDSQQVRMATVLVALSSSTLLLGLALMLTGRLRLAVLVQYLPLPVVGGYLAFIGLYCLEAGLALMSGVQVTSLLGLDGLAQWSQLLQPAALLATLPGVACGLAMLLALSRYDHFLLLPGMLLAIPLAFFIVALAAGYDLEQLRDAGWIAPAQPAAPPLEAFRFFRLEMVRWELLPSLLPTWFGMCISAFELATTPANPHSPQLVPTATVSLTRYVVVAFSSSLDVAAIQMDMGKALDFNRELISVGISNLLSGLTGGFTGSYIFSQTIFTFRSGTNSRVCGLVVVLLELGLFVLPISLVSCVPKLFFGAVLTFIAADLMRDWLWQSRTRVHPAEYAIIWCTFLLINLGGLEIGMACGVLVAMLHFILDYARVPVVQRISLRSNVMRSPELASVLDELQPAVMTLRCRGYIFFGSSVQITNDVLSHVALHPPPDAPPPERCATEAASRKHVASPGVTPAESREDEAVLSEGLERGGHAHRRRGESSQGGRQGDSPAAPTPTSMPTRFVVFDFTMVSGLDATAARSCFLSLCRTLATSAIVLVFGGVAAGGTIHRLLLAHEILRDRDLIGTHGAAEAQRFDTIDEALEYCEEQLLLSSPKAQQHEAAMRAARALGGGEGGGEGGGGGALSGGLVLPRSRSSADQLGSSPPLSLSASEHSYEMPWAAMMQGLAPYFTEAAHAKGEQIFRRGEAALSIHFIVTGEVTLYEPLGRSLSPTGPAEHRALSGVRGGGSSRGASRPQSAPSPGSPPSSTPSGRRLMRYVNGGIFGEL
jgi:SulP family sulfate permease